MKQKIRDAFDTVTCEEALKDRTRASVIREMRQKQQTSRRPEHRFTPLRLKWAVSAACLVLLMGSGLGGYRLYYTEAATISIDVNPSIELDINRWGRVVDEVPYGTDGETVLREVSLRHLEYEEAMERLIRSETMQSYLKDDAVIAVTLESKTGNEQLLQSLQSCVDTTLQQCHSSARAEYVSVDGHMCNEAHSHGMSVGKYYAIQELLSVDPKATLEEFKDKSMKEIKGHTEHCEHRREQTGADERREQTGADERTGIKGRADVASDSVSGNGCQQDRKDGHHGRHHRGNELSNTP